MLVCEGVGSDLESGRDNLSAGLARGHTLKAKLYVTILRAAIPIEDIAIVARLIDYDTISATILALHLFIKNKTRIDVLA